jgi:putative DNA primase/helicase
MTPTERILSALADRNCEPKQNGKGWSARCPAHDDRSPSLSIDEGDDGRALLHCHAGCKVDAICSAVGLRVLDLMPTADTLPMLGKPKGGGRKQGKARLVAQYDYRDETGSVVFQAVRFEPKDFRQRRPMPGGGWDWSVKGVRVIPYHLPELLAEPTRPVVIVEGEKDADNLARIGVLATCNAGGAGKWTAEHSACLRGRRVIVLTDNDEAGRNHALKVAQLLQGISESVRIVALPNLPEKGDVSDWISTGGTKEELKRLAEAASVWTPATTAQPWPEIESFDVLDLPAFPTHVLPDVLRHFVEAESHSTQTPPDLAALLSLSVCSVGIARRVVVEPRPGWREPVNLFTAVLLGPGNRKSAVFADTMKPLRELEGELIEAARPAVAREQSDRRQDEARLRKLEKAAAEKGDAEARHEAGNLAANLAEQSEPALPRFIVDDATAEKLGMMMAEQDGRIASMSPEGGVFDLMAGLYSKSGIPQFGVYLMGHSGDDLVTDRVSRESVRVERPALTCAYAMQPAVIEGLAENAAFRGRGLLARFLYAAPQSWIGQRQIAPTPVSDATREAYRQAVRSMAELKGEFVLQLSADAAALLRDWETEIEAMLGDGGQMEIMRDWGAKLAGATLRLAAVLHCVEHGPAGQIEGRTIAAAVEIAHYLVPHAEAVLNMMSASEDTADNDARYVLRWIDRHGCRNFTRSEAQHHGKRRFPKADDIDPALDQLTKRGYIRLRPVETTGPGRPPSPTFDVNPATFADMEPEKRSHNSRNSASEPDNSNSGNIGSALEQSETTRRVRVTI